MLFALGARQQDNVGAVFDEGAQAALAGCELLLGLSAGGDIRGDPDKPHHLCSRIAQESRFNSDPD